MIHLFINALASTAGGGLTYVRSVVPHLAAKPDVRITALVSRQLAGELPESSNVSILDDRRYLGASRRFLREQWILPGLIKRSGAHVLLSAGNFALWNSPVPQVLLSRNSLYTSLDFQSDLRIRGDYRLWLDTHLKALFAGASIRRAECTIAPSAAFAHELHDWTSHNVMAIHHGFDADRFARNGKSLSPEIQAMLAETAGAFRLLFVSHYNYYRNFGTLLRALPILKKRLAPRKVRLILTCKLRSGESTDYHAHCEASLIERLGVSAEVVELGHIPYDLLHRLYKSCDIYVTPAYAESFAHPLVEAMASGLPVVASNLAVHREICGEAALYFDRFSPEQLAQKLADLAESPTRRSAMKERGLRRSYDFSWSKHVDELIRQAETLITGRTPNLNGDVRNFRDEGNCLPQRALTRFTA